MSDKVQIFKYLIIDLHYCALDTKLQAECTLKQGKIQATKKNLNGAMQTNPPHMSITRFIFKQTNQLTMPFSNIS